MHEDWQPTLAASPGDPDITEKLRQGVELNGRKYRNYIDGHVSAACRTSAGTGSTSGNVIRLRGPLEVRLPDLVSPFRTFAYTHCCGGPRDKI